MTVLWVGMMLFSAVYAACTGAVPAVAAAAAEGAAAAVQLALSMAGGLLFWSGLMEVLSRAGALSALGRTLGPLLGRLYPASREDRALREALCANVSANLLGLGNAATPAGVRAAQRLSERSPDGSATDELCRLVVMNTASLQLLPTTVAALRASLGAVDALDILPAVWITSLLSQTAGLLAERVFSRWS